MTTKRPAWLWIVSIIAVAFGLLTIKAGGSVLFIDGEARRAAGNTVDFVLWFNFVAGFFYIVAGAGILLRKIWAPVMAISIAILTLLVFGFFGIHIMDGGEYEQRTIIAMTLRCAVWMIIAIIGYRKIITPDRERDL